MRKIRRIFKNIRLWWWVICNDAQWDHYYFYKVIQHKLVLMKEFYENDAYEIVGDDRAETIDLCLKVVNRIVKNEYLENAFMFHNKKWSQLNMTTKKQGGGLYSLDFYRDNVVSEEDKEQERAEFGRLYKYEYRQQKQDIEYLGKLLTKYSLKWWD